MGGPSASTHVHTKRECLYATVVVLEGNGGRLTAISIVR